jgi:predicted amidophosphoribosyltransferase
MPTCPACGAPLQETAKICRSCGALTGVNAPPKPYAGIFSLVAAVAVGLIALQIVRWLGFLP